MSGHAPGSAVVGVTIAMTVLAAMAVFSRLFARVWIVRNAGLDDGFIVSALVFSVATTVTMILQGATLVTTISPCSRAKKNCSEMGHGPAHGHSDTTREYRIPKGILRLYLGLQPLDVMHEILDLAAIPSDLPSETLPNIVLHLNRHCGHLYLLDVFQCCVCLLAYFVLLDANRGAERWTLLESICCVVSSGLDEVLCTMLICIRFANAGINIFTDIATGLLPLRVLKDLEMPKRQRIALMIVFGLGGLYVHALEPNPKH